MGLTARQIDHRLRTARLHQVHRGVYAVGHRALAREGRWSAAVIAGGPGSVLSHRSAATLWGILDWAGRIEVTAPAQRRPRPGLRFHVARLPADEVTRERDVPVTTVARTLLDLAAVLELARFEKAVNEAEYLQLTDAVSLSELVERYPARRGVAVARRILAAGAVGRHRTRSPLEDRFLPFLARHRLPDPETNVAMKVGDRWIEADCLWREQRVIVELDGRAAHQRASAFESDRARDARLQARGWRTVRVTWRRLQQDAEGLVGDLRMLLSR